MAVVGGGCSVATEPTAEVSHYYNLMQVSPIVLREREMSITQNSITEIESTLTWLICISFLSIAYFDQYQNVFF